MLGAAESPNVLALRRFSRFFTRRLGSLEEHLLDSRLSLTEVRVLYEITHWQGLNADDLGSPSRAVASSVRCS